MMRASRIAGLLTVSASVIGMSTFPAAAKVVVFDNSDFVFQWEEHTAFGAGNYLDITQPPTQTGELTEHSFHINVGWSATATLWPMASYIADGAARVAASTRPMRINNEIYSFAPRPPIPFAPTQLIGAQATWDAFAVAGLGPLLLISGYDIAIGAEITLEDGVHYGWFKADASAWAYETEPGVSIEAPGQPDSDGILHVPSEYPTIRSALDYAIPGQEVVVADGVYTGIANILLDFRGKAITLRSANGPQNCVLKANPIGSGKSRVIDFHSGEGPDSVVSGFTIRDGGQGMTVPGDEDGGAGIACVNHSAAPTITNCIFINNIAHWSSEHGGAVLAGNAKITNCLFIDNSADFGSAVAGDSPTIVNCTFVDNEGDGPLGAIMVDGGAITNCIVFNNDTFAAIWPETAAAVTYSCIEGGFPGVGNIDVNPQFVSPGNYRLAAGSPCIDAASNPAVPRDVTVDLDGNPRFQDDPATSDTGLGRAPIVDMGAYEFQPLDPADFDHDGDVDGFDLALLLGQWTGVASYSPCPPIKPADLNGDCKVNGFDLAILLSAWG